MSNNQLTGRYVLWKSFIILEEPKAVKRTIPHIVLLLMVLLFVGNKRANAQNASVYFGLGTATDRANSQPIDTFGTGIPLSPPQMGGLFETFGGDFMFRPHLGFGVETTFQGQRNYAGLNYRPLFMISMRLRTYFRYRAHRSGISGRFGRSQSEVLLSAILLRHVCRLLKLEPIPGELKSFSASFRGRRKGLCSRRTFREATGRCSLGQ